MKRRVVSAAYVSYGLIDIAISSLSSLILIHMVVLGAICLAAGFGLWMKKAWSIYPLMFVGPLTLTVGVATLYSSIGLVGFGPSTQALLFNLFLTGYSVSALGLFIYTVANRSTVLGP